MKKKISFLLVLSIIYTFFSHIPIVQAANSKVVKLKENKTYHYDLNGDKKKEEIEVKCLASGYNAKIQIYINGKKIFSRKRNALGAVFYLIDLNTKDKYKEILIHAYSDSDTAMDFFAFRYKGKNRKSILEGYSGFLLNSNTKQLRLARFSVLSNSGKNKLYISADSPYTNGCFGSYFIKVPIIVKNGKLVVQRLSTYKTQDYTKKYVYELNSNMVLYTKASTNSKGVTCYSGSKFKALELKPVETNKDIGALYVKVKISSGKIGWLYFPGDIFNYSEYLKVKPAWG